MYDIVYADPPWRYGSQGPRGGKFAALDYPTMSLDELKAMNVSGLFNKDCVLFMWFTGSFILESLELGQHWGFKPIRIDKVWIKTKASGKPHAACGPWGMSDCEFIYLFVKGKMCSKQIQRNQYVATIEEYPGKHSKKPSLFREQIENRFPSHFKKLEMFARESPPGWDVFGNEVNNSIKLHSNLQSIIRRMSQ